MEEKRKINEPTNVNQTVATAMADRDYWTEWGNPLGLDLRGFNGRASATFVDRATGILIYTQRKQVAQSDPLHRRTVGYGLGLPVYVG